MSRFDDSFEINDKTMPNDLDKQLISKAVFVTSSAEKQQLEAAGADLQAKLSASMAETEALLTTSSAKKQKLEATMA